ncbi:MAG: hypothetical protein OK449_03005 [Thaumarchaeota archaeon]|nr:hypothetical protein [Nitrososphaerota archaeon]
MPDLYLGPDSFRFEQVVVERLIAPEQAGNYALGVKDDAGEFIPKYIGRSDTDLRMELISKLAPTEYQYFKFSIGSPRGAFQIECAQFHLFKGKIESMRDAGGTHPVAPTGTDFKCFLCGA